MTLTYKWDSKVIKYSIWIGSLLIEIVGSQALPTLLKAITVKKCVYSNLIVHSPKRPWHLSTREIDKRDQPFDLSTISPLTTPLGFELVTLTLIPLVGPQVLSMFLKSIAVRKCTYLSLIVHLLKCPQHSNTMRVDGHDQPSNVPTKANNNKYSQWRYHNISWTLRQCILLDDLKDVYLGKLWS